MGAAADSSELPSWFSREIEGLKRVQVKWAARLPGITLPNGGELPSSAAAWILAAAAYVEKEAVKHDLIEGVRRNAAAGADVWLAAALEAWSASKTRVKEAWILAAVPSLGGTACVKVLEQVI